MNSARAQDINIQKSIIFLYILNEQINAEIENAIPFTIAQKKKKNTRCKSTKTRTGLIC